MSIARLAVSRLGPIGLQRRIMLYSAVGLSILFVSWGVISARGVDRISDLLLEERITAAESVAAIIAIDLQHVVIDVSEALENLVDVEVGPHRADLVAEALEHLKASDEFVFFQAVGIVVTDENDREISRAGGGDEGVLLGASLADVSISGNEPQILTPSHFPMVGKTFAVVAVPLHSGTAYVVTEGVNSAAPIPSFLPAPSEKAQARDGKYELEVLEGDGRMALHIGRGGEVGSVSKHWPMIADLTAGDVGGAIRHTDGQDHVVAAAPVAGTGFYLVLEQENDQALSVPSEIRYQFIVIGVVGFFGALLVAWFSTRRVVRPTLELVSATERMAAGDLASPVNVKAHDEIAGLAENVETMRIRLAGALSDLEASNQELGERVRQRTGRLTQALRQVISAQEGERERVARDLHDDVAQQLIVLTRSIDNFKRDAAGLDSAAESQLDDISDLARTALATIRRVSRDLRPSVLDDLGLVAALSWIASEASSHSGLDVTVRSEVESPPVSPEVGLALFRIAQEAVHNVERHSQAASATIRLAQADGAITLTVEDDGRGFEVPSRFRDFVRQGSLGLLGMNERAELVGGRLTLESEPGRGARIIAEVPIDALEALPVPD